MINAEIKKVNFSVDCKLNSKVFVQLLQNFSNLTNTIYLESFEENNQIYLRSNYFTLGKSFFQYVKTNFENIFENFVWKEFSNQKIIIPVYSIKHLLNSINVFNNDVNIIFHFQYNENFDSYISQKMTFYNSNIKLHILNADIVLYDILDNNVYEKVFENSDINFHLNENELKTLKNLLVLNAEETFFIEKNKNIKFFNNNFELEIKNDGPEKFNKFNKLEINKKEFNNLQLRDYSFVIHSNKINLYSKDDIFQYNFALSVN